MKNLPLQKLNKKLIYRCLMMAVVVAIPLMILPIAYQHPSRDKAREERPVQAMVPREQAFAMSGTEKLPASYEAVKQFEQQSDKVVDPSREENIGAAFEKLGNVDNNKAHPSNGNGYRIEEDPWQELAKEEQKQRALDRFHARRADILFGREKTSGSGLSSGMFEKNLELAQKHLDGGSPEPSGVFFQRNQASIGQLKAAKPYSLSQGTLIPAVFLSEINTDLPGPILARVTYNIWDSKTGQALLIPQNSTLIGEYQSAVGHGQERAQIVWSRVVFPNQQSVNLGAMVGLDKKGISGASGQVNNHYDKIAVGLAMTTALGAGVRITQGKYEPNSASMAQEFGNSFAQETMRLGNKIADKMLSVPPTIVVPMGKRLNVFVEQDLSLRPYSG